jgi:hypothetical protein
MVEYTCDKCDTGRKAFSVEMLSHNATIATGERREGCPDKGQNSGLFCTHQIPFFKNTHYYPPQRQGWVPQKIWSVHTPEFRSYSERNLPPWIEK